MLLYQIQIYACPHDANPDQVTGRRIEPTESLAQVRNDLRTAGAVALHAPSCCLTVMINAAGLGGWVITVVTPGIGGPLPFQGCGCRIPGVTFR